MRTQDNGDAVYGYLIFDVIKKYAGALNIIFMYGHNHNSGDDTFLGGSTSFLKKGDQIPVAQLGSREQYNMENLNFIYMNAGYCGYYWDNGKGECQEGVDHDLTLSSFKIEGNKVTINRWDKLGLHPWLKHAGAECILSKRKHKDICLPNKNVYLCPYTIDFKKSEDIVSVQY